MDLFPTVLNLDMFTIKNSKLESPNAVRFGSGRLLAVLVSTNLKSIQPSIMHVHRHTLISKGNLE